MAADRVHTVERFAEAVNRRDRKTAFACLSPAVIWNATGELLDQKLHYHGREEVWGYMRSLDESFDDLQVDLLPQRTRANHRDFYWHKASTPSTIVDRSSTLNAGCTGSDNTCRAALSASGSC